MSRERYWGLYNTASEEWLIGWSHGLGGPTPVWAMSPPIGRMRYRTASDANHARWKDGHNGYVIPRPFYVVRKPKSRELPAEAQAVIDAARSMSELLSVGAVGSLSYEFHQSIKKYDASR